MDEKKSLRGALSLLEQILPKDDPRQSILWSTPIRFVESQGRSDVGARWDPVSASIEVGRPGFVDQLRFTIVLAHEFTHALDKKQSPADIMTLLQSEERAYASESSVIRPMKSVIAGLEDINPPERAFLQLALKRHKRSGSLLLKMTRFRLSLIAIAFNMSQLRTQIQAAGNSSEHAQLIKSWESQLQQVCVADRPINPQDGQIVNTVLQRFRQYIATNPNFHAAGFDALLSAIERAQIDLATIGKSSRSLASIEARLARLQDALKR